MQERKVIQGRITEKKENRIVDNGRILKFEGITKIVVTNIDYDIINRYYDFEKVNINKVYESKGEYLPNWFVQTIDEFMFGKTHFKDLTKEFPDNEDYAISLMKSKNGLNACYGMSATNPVRESLLLNEFGEWSKVENVSRETLYNKFYKSRNSFMRFEYGLFCTAYARNELIEFYECITNYDYENQIEREPQNFIYSDTDSIFYLSDEETEKRIELLNKKKNDFAKQHKAYIITESGKIQYYDIFELEKEDITQFKFLHSKCYGYYTTDNELHLTIAGVPKKQNGTTRIKELGNLDNLKDNFIFKKCGGTRTVYKESRPTLLNINNHLTEVGSSAIILNTTKELKSCLKYEETFIKEIE